MAKLYSKKTSQFNLNLNPKDETVNFILNYSKALSVLKYNDLKFETLLN